MIARCWNAFNSEWKSGIRNPSGFPIWSAQGRALEPGPCANVGFSLGTNRTSALSPNPSKGCFANRPTFTREDATDATGRACPACGPNEAA